MDRASQDGPGRRPLGVNARQGWSGRARAGQGAGQRIWELLAASAITPVRLAPAEDLRLPEFGCGLTDVVGRATPGAGDLSPAELRDGGALVRARLAEARPAVAAYTGKGVYRAIAGAGAVGYGLQPTQAVTGVRDFLLPSPSGRSGLPWVEKLAWYRGLAQLLGRD